MRAVIPAIEVTNPDAVEAAGVGIARVGRPHVAAHQRGEHEMGTLTKKTEPHQKWRNNQPPLSGPRATARPDTPAQIPMALARSAGR